MPSDYVSAYLINKGIDGAGEFLSTLNSFDLYDMSREQFEQFVISIIMSAMPHERMDLNASAGGREDAIKAAGKVCEGFSITDLSMWTDPMRRKLVGATIQAYLDAGIPF